MVNKWNITDPVWGTINFSQRTEPTVKEIIKQPYFQRLRYTTQLGLAQLVYPSATHTRFSHALGSAYIADRIGIHLGLTEDEHLSIVAYALLHDIGHAPFGHCFHRGLDSLDSIENVEDDTFWSKEIIKNDVDFSETKINGSTVLGVLEDDKLKSIVHSKIDVDRIDYLCRDAYFTGLPYRIDADHLIQSMKVDENNEFLFKKSGISATEGLLFARKQMYKTVYKHPLVSKYEDHLTLIVNELCKEEIKFETLKNIPQFFLKAKDSSNAAIDLVEDFLNLSEPEIWQFLKNLADQDEHKGLKNSADIIINRRKIEYEEKYVEESETFNLSIHDKYGNLEKIKIAS